MAYNGVLIESRIMATNNDALNESAVCTVADIPGGGLVHLEASDKKGDFVKVATLPAAGKMGDLWVAYNPSEHLTEINGKMFSDLSADPRDYVNIKGRTFGVFKPVANVDEIVITAECIVDASEVVKGDILESTSGDARLTRVAGATGATAGSTAFKVMRVEAIPFPQAGIGQAYVKAFFVKCVQA